MNTSDLKLVTVAREAMATRFEIALHGDNPVSLRAAGEEALDEIQRVEAMLSWRNPTSPVALINARAGFEPVRVNPEMFALLARCREFSERTGGAFDITVGPLMGLFGFHGDRQNVADETELQTARELCGMQNLELNKKDLTVQFARPGMRLDFGAIGKGYALDLVVEILRETGVESALVHGGTSSVCALGHPPDADCWKVAVEYPPGNDVEKALPVLSVLELRDRAMSVSAVWGRVFRVGHDTFGHVIDPRTGVPTQNALLGIWTSETATEADALSTALLTEGPGGMEALMRCFPGATGLVLSQGQAEATFDVHAHEIDWFPVPDAEVSK